MTDAARGWRDPLALAGIVVVFIALRLVLFFDPALHLGWNSDAAVFGLMAKAIASGREWPLYFWRQSYMGVMTSYLAAALIHVGNAIVALRLAASIEVLAGILFYWLALRRAFDAKVASVVALWLAIGPAYLMLFSIAPIGGEQMFVLSAVIYWFAEVTQLARAREWFVFGLLAGFGWWIHQGTIFAVAAAVIVVALRSEWWTRVRAGAKPNVVQTAIAILLGIDLLLGVARSFGARVPALFLFDQVLDPLLLLVLVLIAPRLGAIVRIDVKRAVLFAAGALIAYAPVIVGTWRGVVPETYGLDVPLLSPPGVVRHVVTFFGSDAWLFVGAAAAVVVVPFFIAAMLRRPSLGMPVVTIILCVCFYFFSQRAHPGSMRYIVSALPMVYAFAALEMLRARIAWLPIAAVTLALLVPRVEQVRDVARGDSENYANLGGHFDPRPVLQAIEARHYSVCYAEYWVAYKLQWVSDERVRFIPFRSFDRNPAASRALAATPAPKCFVDDEGRVRPFDPRELANDALGRAAAERLRRLRSR